MSTNIATGQWTTKGGRGEAAQIDIIEQGDGAVRVRMVLKKGSNVAMYSDFFGSREAAFKWAENIVVVYGDWTAQGCQECLEFIWPWEEMATGARDADGESQTFHLSCLKDEDEPEVIMCSWCKGTHGNHVKVQDSSGAWFDCKYGKVEAQWRAGVITVQERNAKIAEMLEADGEPF